MHESVQFIIRNNYCKILKLMNCDIHNHYIFISYHLLHQLCPNYVNVCFTKSLLSNSCRVLRRVMPQQDRPRHMSSAASSAGCFSFCSLFSSGCLYKNSSSLDIKKKTGFEIKQESVLAFGASHNSCLIRNRFCLLGRICFSFPQWRSVNKACRVVKCRGAVIINATILMHVTSPTELQINHTASYIFHMPPAYLLQQLMSRHIASASSGASISSTVTVASCTGSAMVG